MIEFIWDAAMSQTSGSKQNALIKIIAAYR